MHYKYSYSQCILYALQFFAVRFVDNFKAVYYKIRRSLPEEGRKKSNLFTLLGNQIKMHFIRILMKTFADKIIEFNRSLNFNGELPDGIRIMNPFWDDKQIIDISSEFYRRFYSDYQSRYMILGINPGRFGAGVTGIPFTDIKRLVSECGISYNGRQTHEPSSVFVYDVIRAFGGTTDFYRNFYIGAVCPLGFVKSDPKGNEKNYNYYDSRELTGLVTPFILESIKKQLEFGINRDMCFCFGTGMNEKFLSQLNDKHRFFKKIIALEHPRFVMQYKAREKQLYINKYLQAFNLIR